MPLIYWEKVMAMRLMQKGALVAAGLAAIVVLTGCATAQKAVAPKVAEAAVPAVAFQETEKVDDLSVTLTADPLKAGTNHFEVTLSDKTVTAVEAQVIMASMGHGNVVEMPQVAPGKFALTSDLMNMDGRWMVRIEATLASGDTKTATFYLVVPK